MAAPDFNDVKIGLRSKVLGDPTVAGLIGTRLFSAQLATFFTEGTSFPLATFHPLEGPDNFYWRRFNIRMQTWSNVSYDECHTIYGAIRDVIACTTIKSKTIIRIFGGITEDYNEDSRLYSVSGSYLITQLM